MIGLHEIPKESHNIAEDCLTAIRGLSGHYSEYTNYIVNSKQGLVWTQEPSGRWTRIHYRAFGIDFWYDRGLTPECRDFDVNKVRITLTDSTESPH